MTRVNSVSGIYQTRTSDGVVTDHPYEVFHRERYNPISTAPLASGKFVHPTSYEAYWKEYTMGRLEQKYRTDAYSRWLKAYDLGFYEAWFYDYIKSSDCNNIINKAIVAAGDAEMDLSETIGGAKDTFQMIADRSKQIVATAGAVRRGDLGGAFRSLFGRSALFHENSKHRKNRAKLLASDGAGFFLEYLFGWSQLVKDVYDGTGLIQNGVSSSADPNGYVRGFAFARRKYTYNGWPNYTSFGSTDHKWHINTGCKARFLYRFDHPSKLRTLNQLGILNPVSAAWKLTSLSFVADWFFPVGDYLDAFSAPTGLQFLDGYLTIFNTAESSATPYQGVLSSSAKLTIVPKIKHGVMRRYKLNDTPVPPRFQVPTSIKQAQIGVALLLSRL